MSKDITIPDDLSELSEEDALYLHQRGRITDEQLAQALGESEGTVTDTLKQLSQPTPLEEVANTGDANTRGITKEELEKSQERAAAAQGAGTDEDSDALDPEDYESATNDELRAELARRELDVSGRKDDLVTRLREDDAEEE